MPGRDRQAGVANRHPLADAAARLRVPGIIIPIGKFRLLAAEQALPMNPVSLSDALERLRRQPLRTFTYTLQGRERRGPVQKADGILDAATWRSSMNFEYFSIASDGHKEWRGPPEAHLSDLEASPPTLLQPLWLVGLLYGASTSDISDGETIEADVTQACERTGLDLARPPEGHTQQLTVSIDSSGELLALEATAYLGTARIEFTGTADREPDWQRTGAW